MFEKELRAMTCPGSVADIALASNGRLIAAQEDAIAFTKGGLCAESRTRAVEIVRAALAKAGAPTEDGA